MKKVSKNSRKKKSKISKKDYLQVLIGSKVTTSGKNVIIV